jgi:hypothetical protein
VVDFTLCPILLRDAYLFGTQLSRRSSESLNAEESHFESGDASFRGKKEMKKRDSDKKVSLHCTQHLTVVNIVN